MGSVLFFFTLRTRLDQYGVTGGSAVVSKMDVCSYFIQKH